MTCQYWGGRNRLSAQDHSLGNNIRVFDCESGEEISFRKDLVYFGKRR